jgi:hypothetical protein
MRPGSFALAYAHVAVMLDDQRIDWTVADPNANPPSTRLSTPIRNGSAYAAATTCLCTPGRALWTPLSAAGREISDFTAVG